MKIEKGMYVRTINDGFGIVDDVRDDGLLLIMSDGESYYFLMSEISKKISHDVMDVLKPGDFVNDSKVLSVRKDLGCVFTLNRYIRSENIEKITAREEFDNIGFNIRG